MLILSKILITFYIIEKTKDLKPVDFVNLIVLVLNWIHSWTLIDSYYFASFKSSHTVCHYNNVLYYKNSNIILYYNYIIRIAM